MSRRIEDLHPALREICIEHLYRFKKKHPKCNCVLSFTYRSMKEQDELWKLGRNENGQVVDRAKVVTNARGGKSWHNIERDGKPASLAYDVVIYGADGKVLDDKAVEWEDYRRIGEDLGVQVGLVNSNGVRWDIGHSQYRGSTKITLEEAVSGIDPQK